jgi:hypothetical protein
MAYPVNLAQLITRVLQRTNLEGYYGAESFITPGEMTDAINASIADWYDMIRLTTFGGQYYRSSAPINPPTGLTIPQQQIYSLPPDFLSMLSVDVYLSTTWKLKARPYQEEDSAMFSGPNIPAGWSYSTTVWYQLQGANIAFLPIPSGAYNVTLNYTPVAPQLSLNGGQLDSVNSWDEFIVLDVSAKMLLKDGQLDTRQAILAEREAQRQRIEGAAGERDQGGAEVVHDVVGRGGWSGSSY